jgi:hypothetical protein
MATSALLQPSAAQVCKPPVSRKLIVCMSLANMMKLSSRQVWFVESNNHIYLGGFPKATL